MRRAFSGAAAARSTTPQSAPWRRCRSRWRPASFASRHTPRLPDRDFVPASGGPFVFILYQPLAVDLLEAEDSSLPVLVLCPRRSRTAAPSGGVRSPRWKVIRLGDAGSRRRSGSVGSSGSSCWRRAWLSPARSIWACASSVSVIAEIVEQEERIELARVPEPERAAQVRTRPLESGLALISRFTGRMGMMASSRSAAAHSGGCQPVLLRDPLHPALHPPERIVGLVDPGNGLAQAGQVLELACGDGLANPFLGDPGDGRA